MAERGPLHVHLQFFLVLQKTLLSALPRLSGPSWLCLRRLMRAAVGLPSRPGLPTLHGASWQEQQQVWPALLPQARPVQPRSAWGRPVLAARKVPWRPRARPQPWTLQGAGPSLGAEPPAAPAPSAPHCSVQGIVLIKIP